MICTVDHYIYRGSVNFLPVTIVFCKHRWP